TARKSLAQQIDRLDNILDGLADALNEAVSAAVKEAVGLAVKEAVRGVLTEVFTNPAVLEKIRGMAGPQESALPAQAATLREPGIGPRILALIRSRLRVCRSHVRQGLAAGRHQIKHLACKARHVLQRVWRFKNQVMAALGIGATMAVFVYFAGPWLAAVVAGVS